MHCTSVTRWSWEENDGVGEGEVVSSQGLYISCKSEGGGDRGQVWTSTWLQSKSFRGFRTNNEDISCLGVSWWAWEVSSAACAVGWGLSQITLTLCLIYIIRNYLGNTTRVQEACNASVQSQLVPSFLLSFSSLLPFSRLPAHAAWNLKLPCWVFAQDLNLCPGENLTQYLFTRSYDSLGSV